MKAQLTVEADECAIFFRDGKVVKVMDAGRYTLDSSNLPFLSGPVRRSRCVQLSACPLRPTGGTQG